MSLRGISSHAWWFAGILAVLVGMQFFLSPLALLAIAVSALFLFLTVRRPLGTLTFLAVYLPFEPFLLKFVPDELYVFARFFSEGLVYVLAAIVVWRLLTGRVKFKPTAFDLPFLLFILVLVTGAVVNAVSPEIAVLGARQILRFVILYYVALHIDAPRAYVVKLTRILLVAMALQAAIGLGQAAIGPAADEFLLPEETRTAGEVTFGGVSQFWEAGTRIFATLGRYDKLGNFLAFFLPFSLAFLYQRSKQAASRRSWWWVLGLGGVALALTYSRASWIALLIAVVYIGIVIKRDRRLLFALTALTALSALYLAVSGLNVRYITEAPGQTLVERFYESFSAARWRGEYYGIGRVYWMVQTPLTVVPASPFFGWGPGQFGGGAVSALGNTTVYDKLGLPFGVFGSEGVIDNNWFSLWGETGTLGLAFFVWMLGACLSQARHVWRTHVSPAVRSIALGFGGALLGVCAIAMLSTVFEIRTTAFYLWTYAGFIAAFAQERRSSQQARDPSSAAPPLDDGR